ncbi:unnamed protein product [Triticum aestivum]|uniref:Auxin-responsive protein n=1 Tax=Triticum aestivum TaxID=4565 RepID=A0A7H4LP74_WHEAT|nr:unnamed protein product [Triticum aestivum]
MMSGGGSGSGSGAGPSSSSFERHAKRRPPATPASDQQRKLLRLSTQQGQGEEDALAAGVVPPVTVVLDGRCICHRIHLTRHTGYRSLAGALRRMFVDDAAEGDDDDGLDLSNAVPGHVVAYEDMEDDLLLAGDLNWKDFCRVAKRIRIIPAKSTTRRIKQCGGAVN